MGFVLVIVLSLLGILSGLAVALIDAQHWDIQRAERTLSASQAYAYTRGAQLWAKNTLQSHQTNINLPDTSAIQWPKIMPPATMPQGVVITATLWDAQGSFYNINNLSLTDPISPSNSPNNMNGFDRLALAFSPETDLQKIHAFSNEIAYYVSANMAQDIVRENAYLHLPVPCHVPHVFLLTPNELRHVRYYNDNKKLYQSMMPMLVALPEVTTVNINTASALIMTSVFKDLSVDNAVLLIRQREILGGFASLAGFLALPEVKKYTVDQQQLSLISQYFLLKTSVKTKAREYRQSALFYRQGGVVKILWEQEN